METKAKDGNRQIDRVRSKLVIDGSDGRKRAKAGQKRSFLRQLSGYRIDTRDGQIGKISDSLFDDTDWVVRHFVVETGGWLRRREVLIPPDACDHTEGSREVMVVDLTRKQVKQSPGVDSDTHLRSMREVAGYEAQASDGRIGRVEDLLVEQDGWTVKYMVVDTGKRLFGRKVLVAPRWIERISRREQAVALNRSREQIRGGPPYDPAAAVKRTYED